MKYWVLALLSVVLISLNTQAEEQPLKALYDFTVKIKTEEYHFNSDSDRTPVLLPHDFPSWNCTLFAPTELDILNKTHGSLDKVANDLSMKCVGRPNGAEKELHFQGLRRNDYGFLYEYTVTWFLFFDEHYKIPILNFELGFDHLMAFATANDALSGLDPRSTQIKETYGGFSNMTIRVLPKEGEESENHDANLGGINEDRRTVKIFRLWDLDFSYKRVQTAAYFLREGLKYAEDGSPEKNRIITLKFLRMID